MVTGNSIVEDIRATRKLHHFDQFFYCNNLVNNFIQALHKRVDYGEVATVIFGKTLPVDPNYRPGTTLKIPVSILLNTFLDPICMLKQVIKTLLDILTTNLFLADPTKFRRTGETPPSSKRVQTPLLHLQT